MDHASITKNCNAKAVRIGIGKLKASEKIVVLVSRANSDIKKGGLSQFFIAFPKATWPKIAKTPLKYLDAQWHPDPRIAKYIEPWKHCEFQQG